MRRPSERRGSRPASELRTSGFLGFVLCIAGVSAAIVCASESFAAPQNSSQRKCITTLNDEARKLAQQRGKDLTSCIADAANGAIASARVCADADSRGKVAGSLDKIGDKQQALCVGVDRSGMSKDPDFADPAPSQIGAATRAADLGLADGLLGTPAELGLISHKTGKACQKALLAGLGGCVDTRLKEFGACKKKALAAGAPDGPSLGASCLGATQPDPKGKIAGSCNEKLALAATKSCADRGIALDAAAPRCAAADAAGVAACLDRAARCQTCQTLSELDDLSHDCDLSDDNAVNDSCTGAQPLPVQLVDTTDVSFLASDTLAGRHGGTPQSVATQDFLIDELIAMGAEGANASGVGRDAYRQEIGFFVNLLGNNVLGVIRGSELPGEYVIVGAHYDGLAPGTCDLRGGVDPICNGATDNATGVAAALALGRAIAAMPVRPRRSVVLAFWDREEDGIRGSADYVMNPLLPLADTIAYVNFDIQGANLLPSLRNFSAAVGSETGGAALAALVDQASTAAGLETRRFSHIFGQNRSDYIRFSAQLIPVVFFSDATGGCYHTNDDEVGVVDFGKLEKQAQVALLVTLALANTATRPTFTSPGTPTNATFEDARSLQVIVSAAVTDLALFQPGDQTLITQIKANLDGIVAAGAAAFDPDADQTTVLLGALNLVTALGRTACDGHLAP